MAKNGDPQRCSGHEKMLHFKNKKKQTEDVVICGTETTHISLLNIADVLCHLSEAKRSQSMVLNIVSGMLN